MIRKIKVKLIEEFFLEAVAVMVLFFIFAGPTIASEITPEKVIKLVNIAREKEGLLPLEQDETLTQVAKDKLKDMIDNGYFAHTSPTGKNPWHWFSIENYDYEYAGENLAINFTSAEEQQDAWMKSQTHKKNILNPNYKEIGVAFGAGEIDGEMSLITVQEFGARAIASASSENGENFLMQKNGNFLKEGAKFLPQVLSVRSENPGESGLKNENPAKIDLTRVLPKAADTLSLIATLLFLGSIAILPISFLAVAFNHILFLHGAKRHVH